MISGLSDFRIFLSILFHSVAVEGKKEFLKKSCLTLKEGIFSTYLAKYDLLYTGITFREVCRRLLVEDLIKVTVFDTIVFFREVLILTLGSFSLEVPLIAPVIARAELY